MTAQPPSSPPPGWYPAPDGPFERWWDGGAWGESRPGQAPGQPFPGQPFQGQPLPNQPQAATSQIVRLAGWILTGCGVVMAISTLLPWASVLGESIAGTSTGDGKVILVAALIVTALGVVRGIGVRGRGWALGVPITTLVIGLLVTLISIIDAADISSVGNGWLAVSVGFGLILTILSGIATVAASVLALARNR